jgi:hypothetical protein
MTPAEELICGILRGRCALWSLSDDDTGLASSVYLVDTDPLPAQILYTCLATDEAILMNLVDLVLINEPS